MLTSFNVAMVVDPLEAKCVTNTLKEKGAFEVSTAYIYTKSSSLNKGDGLLTSSVGNLKYHKGMATVVNTSPYQINLKNSLGVLKNYFTSERSKRVNYFLTREVKFRVSKRQCNILFII